MTSTTMYMAVYDHTPYHLLPSVHQITTEAAQEWNHVPQNRLQLVMSNPTLLQWIDDSPHILATQIHFHSGSSPRNVSGTDMPCVSYTNFTFDPRWSVPVRASVHVYTDYIPDWNGLYNVVLYELGHVNLLDRPDVYRKVALSDTNLPVMAHSFRVEPTGYIAPQFRSHLTFDDVGGVMFRMFIEDSIPITSVVEDGDMGDMYTASRYNRNAFSVGSVHSTLAYPVTNKDMSTHSLAALHEQRFLVI